MSNEMVAVIEEKSNDVVTRANALAVKNNEQYVAGTEFQRIIKGLKKEINEAFDPGIAAAYKAHKVAKAQKAKYYDPVDAAHKIVNRKLSEFVAEEERKRAEAEAKLRRAAEKKEAELREKARLAEESGKEQKAAKYEEKAEQVIAPTLNSTVQKVAGVQKRVYWSAVVVDKSKIPSQYLEVNMSALNAVARATKGESTIPGVRFVKEVKVV